jgi:transcriptional/translational regulatory protein YebC/TACO1
VLDAGAEEVNDNGDTWEIVSEASDFVAVRQAIEDAGIDYDSAEASFVPNLQVPLDVDGAKKMIRVIDALEDSDDVQNVYANGDIPDDVLAELDDDE